MEVPNADDTQENVIFLFKHFLKVTDANIQKNGLQRLVKTQALIFKFFEHVGSYIYLSKGTKIPEIVNGIYLDIGTLSVTARATFETMLVFYYVAVESRSDEEVEFKINCLVYSGLLERIEASKTFTEESKIKLEEKIEKEQNELIRMKAIIINSDFYSEIKPDKQRDIINRGKWRLKSWKEIAICLEMNEKHFEMVYGYLCTQAHSGGNSFIQMRSAIVEKDTKRDCKSLDIIILQTLSLVINLLVKISPYSKKEHENNSKAFEYANFYNDFFKKN